MREVKLENTLSVTALGQKIWNMFDILRGQSIASEYYSLILFLLSLYKDGIITKDIFSSRIGIHKNLINSIKNSNEKDAQQYLSIYKSFDSALESVDSKGLNAIIQATLNLNQKILSDNFPEIFDTVLYRITQSQGKIGGEFIQPLELTRFICGLTDLPEGSKVFNPFAGLASFGVFIDEGLDYFGQEINPKTWALGALRMKAYKRPGNSNYACDDSILNWPKQSEKFDLILTNPPYGIRLGKKYKDIDPNIRTIEQFLIEKGVNSLNTKGKLIAILPVGFLFRGMHEKSLRQKLIEEDLIDTIISLPGGLLFNTGIPLAVIIINKDKKIPGKVRLIDANKFVDSKSSREKILNDYRLKSVVRGSYKESEFVRIVDKFQIKKYDYNLNVPRYFQKHIKGIKLKDIVELVRGSRRDIPKKGKMIRIRDLKEDKLNFRLDISNIEKSELRRPNLRSIDESCLLLATRWKTLKPTYFKFSGDPIFINPNILSFKVNEQIADTSYLINELHADYVKEQLASYRQGTSIPMIRRNDLLDLVIKLPSLEEQKAKVQGIAEVSDDVKFLEQERNALAQGKEARQFNEFASLKHTLGRPRQNILDWTDNLIHFLKEKPEGFDALNKSFLDFYETDILLALQEIKRDVNFMTDILEKGENGFTVDEFNKTIISLSDVNRLIKELSSNSFNFKIKKLLLDGKRLKERGIEGNKNLLKTLIDNILTNAHKYGFEEKSTKNEVIFELQEIDDFLLIEVRNNGKPFPKNFDRDNFTTKYSTADSKSGSGLGGYDIHRIAAEFNNPDWELLLNKDPIYLVKFRFRFPIKLNN